MDLETIIPLVIVAVAYLFKAFENARKGERKKRRPPSKPSQGNRRKTARERPPVAGRTPERSRPLVLGRTPESQELPGAPKDRETPASPAPSTVELPPEGRWWWEEELSPPPRSSKSGSEEPSRTAQSRKTEALPGSERPAASARASRAELPGKLAREKRQPVDSPPHASVEEAGGFNEYVDFDLEDAVIKSVILERREF